MIVFDCVQCLLYLFNIVNNDIWVL